MIITNRLNIKFNYDEIDEDFDFYKVNTSKDYIDKGARMLDTALDELKAFSVAFDYGKSAFLMFKKDATSQPELARYLSKQDPTLTVLTMNAQDFWPYLLTRLFLHALANDEKDDEAWLSNLSGKFFITRPEWVLYNGARAKVLQIDVTKDLELTADATTFTDISKFGPLANEYSRKFPMYALSRQNGVFKRVFTMDVPGGRVYIRKTQDKVRTRINFLDFSVKLKERRACKCWYLYDCLERLKNRFARYFEIEFAEVMPIRVIDKVSDADYMSKVVLRIQEKGINVLSLAGGDQHEAIESVVTALRTKLNDDTAIVSSDKLDPSMFNIALVQKPEFYAERHIPDPYKQIDRSIPVQAITTDSLEEIKKETSGGSQPLLCTLLKELVIKDDLIQRERICLDDWAARGFTENWIFGIEHSEVGKKEKRYFFMKIKPDGSLEFAEKEAFKPLEKDYEDCFDYLMRSKEKGKVVVSDGRNAILISRTDRFPLPSPAIFVTESPRGKESKATNFAGLIGINYYIEDDTEFYNVGFVDADDMHAALPNASVIYKTTVYKGANFIERFLETMNVIFVKHNNFTVVPFPVKYLREHISAQLGEAVY